MVFLTLKEFIWLSFAKSRGLPLLIESSLRFLLLSGWDENGGDADTGHLIIAFCPEGLCNGNV
jgi:hypothetical protein